MNTIRAYLAPFVLLAAMAVPAWAALGGDAGSVNADVTELKGALRITSTTPVATHEITAASGTLVREYLGPDGHVFAVSWRGPANPNLRQLLGAYYTQVEQAYVAALHRDRRHLNIEEPGLVVRASGRPRAFYGRAWLPDRLPTNFSVDDIQ